MSNDLKSIAVRIAEETEETEAVRTVSLLKSDNEYSVSMEVSLSVQFDGIVEQRLLMEKLKNEIISAIESGVTVTARSFQLKPSNLRVKPLSANVDVNSAAALDDSDV